MVQALRKISTLKDKSNVFLKFTAKQIELFNAVLSAKYWRVLYGGAVGGAKTVGLLMLLCILCRIYPGSRWVVVRKDNPVLKRNTMPSFWKHCPKPFFHTSRYNKLDQVAIAKNGSQIIFMSENLKDDPELIKFDGLEINGALIEQGEETSKELYLKLIDRVGRWKIPIMPPPLIMLSCNPHQGYLKELFYNPYVEGKLEKPYCFIPALITDNVDPETGKSNLPETYLESLKELKKIAPNLYKKRVKGSWDAADDVQQLISWNDLWECKELISFTKKDKEEELIRSLGIDVGRYGPDPSKWYVLEGNMSKGFNIIYKKGHKKTSAPQVEQVTKEIINKFSINHERCWMDVVGLGGPCLDHLHKDGYEIQSFIGGAKPLEQFVPGGYIFKRLNCQASWNTKMLIESGRIGGIDNDKLRNDLAAYGYDIKGEKMIEVWGKEQIKKKIKRSPDDGDALKYGVWGAIFDTIEPMPGFETI